MRKIRTKILKAIDPTALQHPIFTRLAAQEERMAADPEIQRRRAEVDKIMRREKAVSFAIVALFGCALWGGIVYSLPDLVSPSFAVAGALATLAALAGMLLL